MTLKYAILGFLSFKSLSGYDLKKGFDESVQHFWPVTQTQIYRTLGQLVDEASAIVELIPQADKPNRKLYHITDEGREALRGWLMEKQAMPAYRDPFLVRLYFSGQLTPEEGLILVDNQIAVAGEVLATYEVIWQRWQEALAGPLPYARFMVFLTLEEGIYMQKAYMAWLERVRERLVGQDYVVDEVV